MSQRSPATPGWPRSPACWAATLRAMSVAPTRANSWRARLPVPALTLRHGPEKPDVEANKDRVVLLMRDQAAGRGKRLRVEIGDIDGPADLSSRRRVHRRQRQAKSPGLRRVARVGAEH